METLLSCPICNHDKFNPFLSCVDHTVSRGTFNIVECNRCEFKFTNPRPAETEIDKYYKSVKYVSHSNSSKGLINWIYQIVRNHTLKQKLKLINRLTNIRQPSFKNLLDIGCGTGEFLNTCKNAGYNVVGIEPSSEARRLAQDKYSLDVRTEESIKKFDNESFDIITMWHVLEHVHRLNERVAELKRLLKKNGVLIVAVPNPNSFDAKFYKENWAAYDVPRHLYHFVYQDIKSLFENKSMEVREILPMKFDSFYVSMLSEKNRGGGILNGILNGWLSNRKASEKNWSSQIYIIR